MTTSKGVALRTFRYDGTVSKLTISAITCCEAARVLRHPAGSYPDVITPTRVFAVTAIPTTALAIPATTCVAHRRTSRWTLVQADDDTSMQSLGDHSDVNMGGTCLVRCVAHHMDMERGEEA